MIYQGITQGVVETWREAGHEGWRRGYSFGPSKTAEFDRAELGHRTTLGLVLENSIGEGVIRLRADGGDW